MELVYTRLQCGRKVRRGLLYHLRWASRCRRLRSSPVQPARRPGRPPRGKRRCHEPRAGVAGRVFSGCGPVPRVGKSRARTPYVAGSQLDIVEKRQARDHGTRVRYWADTGISLGRPVRLTGLLAEPGDVLPRARPDHRHPRRAGLLRPPKRPSSTTAVSPEFTDYGHRSPGQPMSGAFRAVAPHRDGCPLDAKGHDTDRCQSASVVDVACGVGTGCEPRPSASVNIIAAPKGWHPRRRFRAGAAQGLPSPTGAHAAAQRSAPTRSRRTTSWPGSPPW